MNKFTIDIDETFKYHYRSLCLYVLHYVHDTDIAEDIVQDSFSALWEKLSISGAEIENVKAYLYTTARNRSLDYLKKEEIYDPNLSPSDFEDTLSDEEAEERSVREARMWTAIDALPERCREIFLLNKRDGMKYREIAAKFQISVHTVPSISWSTALPISCNKPALLAILTSNPISAANNPERCATSIECFKAFCP